MTNFDIQKLRAAFPALHQEINGKPLVYLDSAASSMKPQAVIDSISDFYSKDYSNVHRGVHTLSQRATALYEQARADIADFLDVPPEELVFVRGTTEGLNLIAASYGGMVLQEGDEVVISAMEHHANIVPWQLITEARGAKLVVMDVDERGDILDSEIESKIGPKTKIVSVAQVSNALGTVNDIKRIAEKAHAEGAIMVVDGAQGVPHGPVHPKELGADFYVFSGHKMFGPTGIGALYGRKELLSDMPPYQSGGDMIQKVTFEKTTFREPPIRFEAGTPSIAQAIGLGAAARWMMAQDFQAIQKHADEVLAYGHAQLREIPGLRFHGEAKKKASILAFTIEGIHPHDLGTLLDLDGIAIRVGHHCAEPILARFGLSATARASLGIYSTHEEIDALVKGLYKTIQLLR